MIITLIKSYFVQVTTQTLLINTISDCVRYLSQSNYIFSFTVDIFNLVRHSDSPLDQLQIALPVYTLVFLADDTNSSIVASAGNYGTEWILITDENIVNELPDENEESDDSSDENEDDNQNDEERSD